MALIGSLAAQAGLSPTDQTQADLSAEPACTQRAPTVIVPQALALFDFGEAFDNVSVISQLSHRITDLVYLADRRAGQESISSD